jgi:hypothetical protein
LPGRVAKAAACIRTSENVIERKPSFREDLF